MNQLQAADYVGYSADHFRKLVKKFNLKRCGPNGTRYARADLDAFMTTPDQFAAGAIPTKHRKPILLEV